MWNSSAEAWRDGRLDLSERADLVVVTGDPLINATVLKKVEFAMRHGAVRNEG